jgi:hypothetical protein
LKLPKCELIPQPDLLGFVLYEEHIHQQKSIPHKLGPGMVIEIRPRLGYLQLCLFDARHPRFQLLFLAEIVVSIQPVIASFSPLYRIL